MKPNLCLGTAQFGLDYGITNKNGKVSESEVVKILTAADSAGITWIDTAQAYGDSETVLGRNLPEIHNFKLISKLTKQSHSCFTDEDSESWNKRFQQTCDRLGTDSLDALLLHSANDLKKPGSGFLKDWLYSLREKGLVKRLGISIYTSEDLEGVSREFLDIVQLPLSLFDQRLLADGTVSYLKNTGAAIHARSLYLQGLLLTPAQNWPDWIKPEARRHQQALESVAMERGCSLIEMALGFAQMQAELEAVVIGICNAREVIELKKYWCSPSPWIEGEWKDWGLEYSNILDPRFWPNQS